MFRFQDPQILYMFGVVVVLLLLHLFTNYRRRARLKQFGDPELLKELMTDVSWFRPNFKVVMMLLALSLLIVMMARPQFGTKVDTEKRSGIEAIIAVDVSNSMMAQDVLPSRLDKSKMVLTSLIDDMKDDKVGLVIFAGDAFTQMPISADYVSARMFLDGITTGSIPNQGTDIAGAINLASKSFTNDKQAGKAIIILTDGENHEGGAVEAAKEAVKNGMKVYMLGVGTAQGAPIPTKGNGQYKTDQSGNVVISKLNEDMCREVASAGGGAYINVGNTDFALKALEAELGKLAKSQQTYSRYSEYDEQFQAFALLAFIMLLIDICVIERKNRVIERIKFFKK